jgi:hypothetical protein
MILDEKLAAGDVIVLDGATGTEIARKGGAMNGAAWCAVANLSHPDIVRQVHEDYIRAGADVVIANTFATCRHVLAGADLADETVRLNRSAVELAREARERADAGRPVAVAGSISNTMAWIPGTISPDPRYVPTPEQEEANYREVAETFAEAGVDFIVLEMMLDIEHASRAVAAAVSTGLPVWVGISATRQPDGRMTGWDARRYRRCADGAGLPGRRHHAQLGRRDRPRTRYPVRALAGAGDGLSRDARLRSGDPHAGGDGAAGRFRQRLPRLGRARRAGRRRLLRHDDRAHPRHGRRPAGEGRDARLRSAQSPSEKAAVTS